MYHCQILVSVHPYSSPRSLIFWFLISIYTYLLPYLVCSAPSRLIISFVSIIFIVSMDPLSITAGILAIFDAGGKVGKGLKKLIRLKDAPSAFLALNNEAVDFNCVVQDVHNLLQSCPKELPLPQSIIGALDQARSTSLAVEKLIAYELTTMTSKTGQRVDRSSWLRAEHKIVAMKEGIKDSKVSLAYALSLLSS